MLGLGFFSGLKKRVSYRQRVCRFEVYVNDALVGEEDRVVDEWMIPDIDKSYWQAVDQFWENFRDEMSNLVEEPEGLLLQQPVPAQGDRIQQGDATPLTMVRAPQTLSLYGADINTDDVQAYYLIPKESVGKDTFTSISKIISPGDIMKGSELNKFVALKTFSDFDPDKYYIIQEITPVDDMKYYFPRDTKLRRESYKRGRVSSRITVKVSTKEDFQ